MWTYHALLLFVCQLLAISTEGGGEVCQSTHFLQIQEKCRDRNHALLEAEKDHDDVRVCTSLYDLWHCVASHVPVCFHNVTEIYKSYFHSPHNCFLTVQQLQTLQALTLASANKPKNNDTNTNNNNNNNNDNDKDGVSEGGDDYSGDVDVSVDVVPLSSTTTTPPSSSSRKTMVTTVTVKEDEGGGGGGSDNTTTTKLGNDSNNSTGRHKHTGSGTSPCCSHYGTFTTLAVSWLVTRLLMTSFCSHS